MRLLSLLALLLVLALEGCISESGYGGFGAYRPASRGRPSREKPRPAPGFDPFRKLARKLRSGMEKKEVFKRLGAPQRVVNLGSGRQKWRYGHPKRHHRFTIRH